ncbi:hypothetical protein Adt_15600 [Abeliophyllum distichum]|uniref:Uncharacterized protein n=1 Tax=Abeliophyllum distichum TaxID=126358 RepID=A0ABD1U3K2_9LAMI
MFRGNALAGVRYPIRYRGFLRRCLRRTLFYVGFRWRKVSWFRVTLPEAMASPLSTRSIIASSSSSMPVETKLFSSKQSPYLPSRLSPVLRSLRLKAGKDSFCE